MRRPPILLQKLCELSTSPPWRWAISATPHADGGRAEWEGTCPPEQRRLRAATAGDAALLLGLSMYVALLIDEVGADGQPQVLALHRVRGPWLTAWTPAFALVCVGQSSAFGGGKKLAREAARGCGPGGGRVDGATGIRLPRGRRLSVHSFHLHH